jgi:hypothetical protein
MMLRRPDGRRSRLGAVAMHANLHKRTHQVLENKGFSILASLEIVHYEYIFRKAAEATACVFGAFAEVRKGQAPHDLASTIQLENSKNKATLCLDLLRFLRRRVVLHCRSRGATGSHPSGTPVARQERPARQPPSPASGRRDIFRSSRTNPLCPWIRWVFLEAGGAPLPVARRDRLSSVWHAGRETKSDQRASHLLPRTEEGTFSEVQEQTHFVLGFAGFFWRLVVLDHRSRGATGSHPSGTPVARQERPARQPPSPANGRRDGLGRGEC